MSTDHAPDSTAEKLQTPDQPSACPAEDVVEAPRCPPPLAWQDVLSEFRDQSECFDFTTDGGLQVRGRVFGEGPPLYILNGFSGSPEIFCLTVWLLREDFRCVVLEYPAEATSLSDLASCVFMAADGLGDQEFDLYATGFGTSVALKILTTNGSRVRHAVLQGAMNALHLSGLERLATAIGSRLPGRMRHIPFFRIALQNNHRLWFPPIDPTRWFFMALDFGYEKIQSVASRLRILHDVDWSSKLKMITTPTFVISSEGEAQRHRDAADLFAEQIPNARSEQIPNSGHVPFVTHPHRLAKLIGPFYRDEPSK